MNELAMIWIWAQARVRQLRRDPDGINDDGINDDAGFTTLEWVGLAGVIIVAAIVVATILMNTAKDGANKVKVQ
ncbi:MAG: hypothetical protein ACTHMS_10130 [Jatrophihabitans sp.]|uniref:hypothetical protein n=1 Tax=Jatrophihabitans sp. TaxID=1932789 RepID=UPI003F8172BE